MSSFFINRRIYHFVKKWWFFSKKTIKLLITFRELFFNIFLSMSAFSFSKGVEILIYNFGILANLFVKIILEMSHTKSRKPLKCHISFHLPHLEKASLRFIYHFLKKYDFVDSNTLISCVLGLLLKCTSFMIRSIKTRKSLFSF